MSATSWSLTVATYKRHRILVECVKRALGQTRKPAEVIVVDASPDWEEGAAVVRELCLQANVPCQYVKASAPSLAVQRNQAIDLASSDILFMIDDDSMMFPDAAQKVLEVYEVDTRGAVAGVQISPVDESPPSLDGTTVDSSPALELKETGRRDWVTKHEVGRLIYKEIFLMNRERSFVPYLGSYPDAPVPPEVAGLDVYPTRLFTGCAMTYRRTVISRVRFNSLLKSYCPAEDLDASYRASLHGCLVVARGARLKHVEVAAGRIKRRIATCLWASNLALFVRQNAQGSSARRREFTILLMRRFLADLLKDAGSRRFDFPQFRGLLQAVPICRKVFTLPESELQAYYLAVQEQLLQTKA